MADAKIRLALDGVQSVVGGLEKVNAKVNDVATSIAGLTAVGGALSVGGLALWMRGVIDTGDKLADLSTTTGITVEQLTGLEWAAKNSGTTLEDVAKAVNKMSTEMGKEADKFARLGISAKEPLEAFKQLADRFREIQDPQQRAALAAAALGKSWTSVAPLLAEGGAKIGEMVDKGQRLSGITTEMTVQAKLFNEQLEELKALSAKVGVSLASELLPGLNSVLGAVKEAYQESGKLQAAWVALGGLGAFLYTDEFLSEASKTKKAIGNVRLEIMQLEERKKQLRGGGYLQRWLFGTEQELDDKIEKAQAQLAALEKTLAALMQPPASTPKPKPSLTGDLDLDGSRQKRYEAAITRSEEFIAQIKKETFEIGASTADKKLYEAEQIAGLLRLAGASDAYLLTFLNNSLKESDALEARKKSYERDEAIKKAMLKSSEELNNLGRKQIETIQDQLKSERERNQELGLSAEQVADLVARRLELEALSERETAAALRAAAAYAGPLHDAYMQYADDLEAAAKAKGLLADEKRFGAARKKFVDAEKQTAADALRVWENFRDNVQRNVGDVLYQTMQGKFDSIGDSFLAMIQRMLADAMAADFADALFGNGKGGNVSGLMNGVGRLFGGLFGGPSASDYDLLGVGLASAAGGYDIPAGVNPLTRLHEREMVLPQPQADVIRELASAPASPRGGWNGDIIQHIHVDSRSDQASVVQAMLRAKDLAKTEILREIQSGSRAYTRG